jgi:hypothetical protein
MKTKLLILFLLVMMDSIFASDYKVQLSLFNPVQLYPETESIHGLRLNVYGKNQSLKGFDIGFLNHLGKGQSKALQWGFIGNISDGNFEGVQFSDIFNISQKTLTGAQLSPFNYANHTEGIQFGLINFSKSLNGVQLGLINIIQEGGVLPIMPFINWDL